MHIFPLALHAACAPRTTPAPAPVPPPTAEHAHRPDHFVDPQAFVAEWNDPERDAWQKPDEIVAALQLEPGDTVVDLGAGTGYLVPALAAAVGPSGRVIAVDVEPAMIAFLEERASQQGWTNVVAHLSSATEPLLPPESADAVVTLNVWHHVADRGAYAARVLQVLKSSGAFVVVDFLKEETEGFGPPLAMRLDAAEVAADLEAGGFREVATLEETLARHHIVRGRRSL